MADMELLATPGTASHFYLIHQRKKSDETNSDKYVFKFA